MISKVIDAIVMYAIFVGIFTIISDNPSFILTISFVIVALAYIIPLINKHVRFDKIWLR